MKKLLMLLMKYIPVIQMAGMLINNTLYCFDIVRPLCYTLDFILGNSLITTILLLIISYVFKFCEWHRIIIISNIINITIANIDAIIGINIEDIELLSMYYVISSIFVIFATINHITQKKQRK